MTRQLPNGSQVRIANYRAFTLIEMLMVFAIIAILIGILVPVVAGAFRRGKEAAEITEINSITVAVESFKDRFGVYPPSQIILREDGDYSDQTMGSVNNIVSQFPGSTENLINGGVHHPEHGPGGVFLREVTVQYLRRIWPQLQLNTGPTSGTPPGIVTTGPNQYFYDWNGDHTFNNATFLLSGDDCLVFFLGGIPVGEPRDNPAIRAGQGLPGVLGFGKGPSTVNPLLPFNPTIPPVAGSGTSRDGPFHEFDSGRLVDWDKNGFWEFLPLRKPGLVGGYAYFSSYEGTGYRPDDVNIDSVNFSTEIEPSGDISIGQSGFIHFRVNWAVPTNYPIAYKGVEAVPTQTSVRSPGPNPYTSGVPFVPVTATTQPQPARYLKPDGFQIISPGTDNSFGQCGAIPRVGKGATVLPYYEVKEDDDNLASFAGGELKDAGGGK